MFVATIHKRLPAGGSLKTFICSFVGNREYNGRTYNGSWSVCPSSKVSSKPSSSSSSSSSSSAPSSNASSALTLTLKSTSSASISACLEFIRTSATSSSWTGFFFLSFNGNSFLNLLTTFVISFWPVRKIKIPPGGSFWWILHVFLKTSSK